MRIVIVSGMSGSGKALAIRAFEDMGYFCVDNVPPHLLPQLGELCKGIKGHNGDIAVVVDVRSGDFFNELVPRFKKLTKEYDQVRVLFLDASDEVLIQRFKETRRRHPLFDNCQGIIDCIATERHLLEDLKEIADKVIDTSEVDPVRLKSEIVQYFGSDSSSAGMIVTVTSFGFKYGIPLDADIVFDVRFLINPYYNPELRHYDGRDQPVQEFVMDDPRTVEFIEKLHDLIDFTLPHYISEGKAYLNIAIGCTGGRHRSVTIANELGVFFKSKSYKTIIDHRDVGKSN
ncbi:MAG: RNase adapter RapZ [Armatimonadota bacterium]